MVDKLGLLKLDQRTEQARAANEAKTRFLANISHELRAPVTAIVGLVRLIRDPAPPARGDQPTTVDDDIATVVVRRTARQ